MQHPPRRLPECIPSEYDGAPMMHGDIPGDRTARPVPSMPRTASRRLEAGTMVDHFRVVRLLGIGGMGEVYLARDTVLGRKVALKLVRVGALMSDEQTRQILAEARATAAFSHPNIVTIYHVGQHEGRPYLALEFLEGETLSERSKHESLSIVEVQRVGLAIAQALQEAHRHKILHRDLKTRNVLIGRDGRVRVLDFGLAQRMEDEPRPAVDEVDLTSSESDVGAFEPMSSWSVAGSPPYMAPEQWTGAPCTGAVDVWALGIILYELLAGNRPFPSSPVSELILQVTSPDPSPMLPDPGRCPPGLVALVHDCLRKDPTQRPTAGQVAEVLADLVQPAVAEISDERSPFRGLQPFGERHASFFFGRDTEVEALLERMRTEPVVPIVGPTGAGKSSLVRAGVVPRLKARGRWSVLQMRPGASPFQSLAVALLRGASTQRGTPTTERDETLPHSLDSATTVPRAQTSSFPPADIDDLGRELQTSPALLALRLQDLAQSAGSRVLLFVDQLEELYALVDDPSVRRSFMEGICRAAEDPAEPVRVLFTLRDDFLSRVAEGPAAREKLSRLMLLREPGPDALREILEKPVAAVGYAYDDPTLVDRMIADVRGGASGLPLLQFATRMLWDRRDRSRRRLLLSVYEDLGGMAGMLAEHGDAVLEGLSPQQIEVARQVLLRLVTPEGTRRVLPRDAVVAGLGDVAEAIVDRLTEARLVTVRRARGDDTQAPNVELAHEALIRGWSTLERWIRTSREELVFLAEVEQAAALWDRRGRPEAEVWTGDALLEARRRLQGVAGLPGGVDAFLAKGEARQASLDRARRVRRAGAMTVLSVVAVVAVLVAWAFANKQREAEAQREQAVQARAQAEGERAAAYREGARAAFAAGRLVEARAKLRGSLETQDSPLARALWARLQRSRLLWQKDVGSSVYDVEFSPDGDHVAAACQDGTVHLYDVQTMAVRFLRGHGDQVFVLAHAPDGKRLASGTWGGDLVVWDLETGAHHGVEAHQSGVRGLAFSPDGQRVASSSWDGSLKIWPAGGGTPLHRFGNKSVRMRGVAFTPDGKHVASADGDGKVRIWPLGGGDPVELQGHERDVTSVDFSPAGDLLASSSGDNTIRVWRMPGGERAAVMRGPAAFRGVRFSPDGRLLSSGSTDMKVRVWDARSGELRAAFEGHTGEVHTVAFHPDGHALASAGYDESIRVWRLKDVAQTASRGHTALTFGVAFSPDATLVASGGYDRSIRIWDAKSGAELRTIETTRPVRGVSFSPDGHLLAVAATDEVIRLYEVESGVEKAALEGHAAAALDVTFSPDGKHLVSSSWDKTIRVWEVATGEQVRVLRGHRDEVMSLSFAPSGGVLASAGADGTLRLWSAGEGRELRVLRGHEGTVYGVSFHPSGERLVSAGADGTVRIWDAKTGRALITRKHPGRVYSAFFHPDGRRVGICRSDGGSLIWDTETDRSVALRGHRAEVNFLAFGAGGKLVATTSDDQTVRVWEVDTGRPYWKAPLMLASPPVFWSHRGWQRLGEGPLPALEGKAWARAVEREARSGGQSPDGKTLCFVAHDGAVQAWDLDADRRRFRAELPDVTRVVALDQVCLAMARSDEAVAGKVVVLGRQGERETLADGVLALGTGDDEVLVSTADRIERYTLDGRRSATHEGVVGVTALGRVGSWIVAGNRDGNLDLIPADGTGTRPSFDFEQTPSSPVVHVSEGPLKTVVAAYANGFLGIWDATNGTNLEQARLHGAVVHVRVQGPSLFAVSELGDATVLDLSVYHQPYCDLLRKVWDGVPVIWEEGLPVVRGLPDEHQCLD